MGKLKSGSSIWNAGHGMVFCACWLLVVINNFLFSIFPVLDSRKSQLFLEHCFCERKRSLFSFFMFLAFSFWRGILRNREHLISERRVIIWTLIPVWSMTNDLFNSSGPQFLYLWNENKNSFLRVTVRTKLDILFVKNPRQCLFGAL